MKWLKGTGIALFILLYSCVGFGADFHSFDGALINKIEIVGLRETSERALRLLLGFEVGQGFSSESWNYAILKLYNTALFYNIQTEIKETQSGISPKKIDIHLSFLERFALTPLIQIQTSSDSTAIELGIRHANLGGYFTRVVLGIDSYNGDLGYRLRAFQEWFLDSEFMFGLEVSKLDFPTVVQDRSGTKTNSFNWSRALQQIAFGRRFGQNVRVLATAETYQDSILVGDPSLVYPLTQYRFKPTVILSRVNLGDYLEEGYEVTFSPSFANFFDSNLTYSQASIRYKQVFVDSHEASFAILANAGAMTLAPLPYQFRLGGFDRIRGFSTNRFIGTTTVSSNLEYRPILVAQHISALGLGLTVLQGCVFTDIGWIGSSQTSQSLALASVGLGIRAILANFANTTIRFDLAQTVSPSEGIGFSFGIGQFF